MVSIGAWIGPPFIIGRGKHDLRGVGAKNVSPGMVVLLPVIFF
jgi:hypothetical protein